MSNHPPIALCKCGYPASEPKWTPRAQGYVIQCTSESCPAVSQAKTKEDSIDIWNRVANKI